MSLPDFTNWVIMAPLQGDYGHNHPVKEGDYGHNQPVCEVWKRHRQVQVLSYLKKRILQIFEKDPCEARTHTLHSIQFTIQVS